MSADNWAVCPRCPSRGEAGRASFREDYEIYGAEDGVVRVDYSGYCRGCNLTLKFTSEHPIPGLTD